MIDVRCICAIGLRGQLGLNGHLPWEGNTDPLFVEDVTRFFALTMGHVLIAGPKTVASVPDFAFEDRTIDVIRSHEDPEEVLKRYPGQAHLRRRRHHGLERLRKVHPELGHHPPAL